METIGSVLHFNFLNCKLQYGNYSFCKVWYQWIGMSDVFGDTFVFEKKKRGEVGKEGHFCI